MNHLSLRSEPQQLTSIGERLKVIVIGGALLVAGVMLMVRGLGGAPEFSELRIAEGTVDNYEFVRVKSARLISFALAGSDAKFSFSDRVPGFESVSELVTNGHAPVRIWYKDSFGARSVWQVGSANTIIVPYQTMVSVTHSSYVTDQVLGVVFCAIGGLALGTLILRSFRRARHAA